jgi:hypothetical protein
MVLKFKIIFIIYFSSINCFSQETVTHKPNSLPAPYFIVDSILLDSAKYFSLNFTNDEISSIKFFDQRRFKKKFADIVNSPRGIFIVKTKLLYYYDSKLFKADDIYNILKNKKELSATRLSKDEFYNKYHKRIIENFIIIVETK